MLVEALYATARGDRNGLQTVFDRTSGKLMGICVRLLGDREEAEDVLQDIYVTVWQRADTFDAERASAITWLATIARNRAIDRLRSRRARPVSAPSDDALVVAYEGPDGFAAAAATQEGAQLRNCLGELENPAQGMIRAAFFEGLAYSQLADRAGVPLGTMKSWIRRGLQQLRQCLER